MTEEKSPHRMIVQPLPDKKRTSLGKGREAWFQHIEKWPRPLVQLLKMSIEIGIVQHDIYLRTLKQQAPVSTAAKSLALKHSPAEYPSERPPHCRLRFFSLCLQSDFPVQEEKLSVRPDRDQSRACPLV